MDKRDQRGFIGGVAEGVILVIAVIFLLMYLYSKYPDQFKKFIGTLKPSPTASTTPTSDTTGWQIYTDQARQFSLRYPLTVQLNKGTSVDGIGIINAHFTALPQDIDDGSHGVEIVDREHVLGLGLLNIKKTAITSLKTYVNTVVSQFEKDAQNSAAGVVFETTPITVDGMQGYKVTAAESSAVANVDMSYYFLKNGYLYIYNASFNNYAPSLKDLIERVVMTLRFTP